MKRALSAGEFLAAYDAARAGRRRRIRMMTGFNNGWRWLSPRWARPLAPRPFSIPLAAKDPTNRETLSILGRTYKDRWCANPDDEHYLRQSFDCYNRAFEVQPSESYPGINAATIAFLLKETDKANQHRARPSWRFARHNRTTTGSMPPSLKRLLFWVTRTEPKKLIAPRSPRRAITCARFPPLGGRPAPFPAISMAAPMPSMIVSRSPSSSSFPAI